MDFLTAIKTASEKATETGRLVYVYPCASGYYASTLYAKGWLFQAYPGGGRKVLSIEGKRLAGLDDIIGEGG